MKQLFFKSTLLTAFILLNLCSASKVCAKNIKLINNSKSNYEIVLYKVSDDVKKNFSPFKPFFTSPYTNYDNIGYEYYAAKELQHYINVISGVQIEIKEIKNTTELKRIKCPIVIGKLAQDIGVSPPNSKFGVDGHTIEVTKNRILLVGETPMATYFSVALLLEKIGCRWYMPGELGEIIPKTKTITLKLGTTNVVPDLWNRMMWYSGGKNTKEEVERMGIWLLRNRQYGERAYVGHAWNGILSPKHYFEQHPEWFALIGGKRNPVQLCTTNKDMIKQFIYNLKEQIKNNPSSTWWTLSPNDGAAFCECINCKSLDPGLNDITMSNLPLVTDRLLVFYNEVIDSVISEYPDKYFTFFAYVNHLAPPKNVKIHPRLIPVITPITYSRYHEMNSKNSETQRALAAYVKEWAEKVDFLLYYTYSYNLGDQLLPYTKEHQIKHDWPFMFNHKLAGVTIETNKSWSNLLPWYYLMAKLNVDMDTDLAQVEKEFYENFFGNAAPYMKQYMKLLSDSYSNMKYELDNMWYAHLLFTPEFLEEAQSYIDMSYKVNNDNMIRKRIKMFDDALQLVYPFLEMREKTNRCDFAGAVEAIDRLKEKGEQAYNYNPEGFSVVTLNGYLNLFWRKPLEFCANKIKNAEIIHVFPDEWNAFLDYSEIGEIGKVYLPEFPLDKWVKLKTYSKTIGEQGLNRFRGHIWYRQSFGMDNTHKDKKLHLLLSGVDNAVNVYLNGKHIGEGIENNFAAVEFDITDAVNFNGENILVLDISNKKIVAMETGGLMRPALIYSPN